MSTKCTPSKEKRRRRRRSKREDQEFIKQLLTIYHDPSNRSQSLRNDEKRMFIAL